MLKNAAAAHLSRPKELAEETKACFVTSRKLVLFCCKCRYFNAVSLKWAFKELHVFLFFRQFHVACCHAFP